jgi:hypothetical protein
VSFYCSYPMRDAPRKQYLALQISVVQLSRSRHSRLLCLRCRILSAYQNAHRASLPGLMVFLSPLDAAISFRGGFFLCATL